MYEKGIVLTKGPVYQIMLDHAPGFVSNLSKPIEIYSQRQIPMGSEVIVDIAPLHPILLNPIMLVISLLINAIGFAFHFEFFAFLLSATILVFPSGPRKKSILHYPSRIVEVRSKDICS